MKNFKPFSTKTRPEHVARIVLNKPETRNSQDTLLLYELNDAFDIAAQDNNVKVIILAANGPHFSGHVIWRGGGGGGGGLIRRVVVCLVSYGSLVCSAPIRATCSAGFS